MNEPNWAASWWPVNSLWTTERKNFNDSRKTLTRSVTSATLSLIFYTNFCRKLQTDVCYWRVCGFCCASHSCSVKAPSWHNIFSTLLNCSFHVLTKCSERLKVCQKMLLCTFVLKQCIHWETVSCWQSECRCQSVEFWCYLFGLLWLQTLVSLEEQKRKTKKSNESLELSTARCSELQHQCLTAEHELKDRVCSLLFTSELFSAVFLPSFIKTGLEWYGNSVWDRSWNQLWSTFADVSVSPHRQLARWNVFIYVVSKVKYTWICIAHRHERWTCF